MGTAGEIVIWMVLAALVGFATGWALRSVVANRARARLSDRLEEKRREAQELREELRRLRGDDDEDIVHVPGAMAGPIPDWEDGDEQEEFSAPSLSQTAEHDEVELGPLDEPTVSEESGEPEIGGSTRAMRLDEVQWEDVDDVNDVDDVEETPRKPAE
jgi:hypothetical protein